MQTVAATADHARQSRPAESASGLRWSIDRDVIRGRRFDFAKKLLPDGLSFADRLEFLNADERRLLSRVQGRTYANTFALLESIIAAKTHELSRQYGWVSGSAHDVLAAIASEELKHQELFRRINGLVAEGMSPEYRFLPCGADVASFMLEKSTWAVRALICHVGLVTQAHYLHSIEPDPQLSDLYKDVLFFHWKDESQHAVLDEFEWLREDVRLSEAKRDQAVDDWIELVQGIDAMLVFQAPADVEYFVGEDNRAAFSTAEIDRLHAAVLGAYRWQYIGCALQDPRFHELLCGMLSAAQMTRLRDELAPLWQTSDPVRTVN